MTKEKKVKVSAPRPTKEKKVTQDRRETDAERVDEVAPEYNVHIELNDQVFDLETNDVSEAILSTAPEFLRTSVVIKITKNGKTLDRFMYLNDGKRLFNNRYALESFVKNLLF